MPRSRLVRAEQKDFSTREFRDGTDMTGVPTGTVYPSKDDAGNLLETEFGLSTYKDSQFVTIQEMPESAPLGQLPRSLEVYLERDLVDSVKPGEQGRERESERGGCCSRFEAAASRARRPHLRRRHLSRHGRRQCLFHERRLSFAASLRVGIPAQPGSRRCRSLRARPAQHA